MHQENERFPQEKTQGCNSISTVEYNETKLDNSSLTVDSHLSSIPLTSSYNEEKSNKMENFKHEDSSSGHSLLVDEQLNNINISNSLADKQVYSLNLENNESLVHLNSGVPKEWFYCNICGKFCEEKADFEVHYETHFYKCSICFAVFTNLDVLKSHRKEAHGACSDDPKVNNFIMHFFKLWIISEDNDVI